MNVVFWIDRSRVRSPLWSTFSTFFPVGSGSTELILFLLRTHARSHVVHTTNNIHAVHAHAPHSRNLRTHTVKPTPSIFHATGFRACTYTNTLRTRACTLARSDACRRTHRHITDTRHTSAHAHAAYSRTQRTPSARIFKLIMTQMQKRARSLVSCIFSSSAHIHARSTDAHIHAEAVTSVHIPSEASM